MLNLVNETPFEARAVPLRDKAGKPVVVFIVKATYDLAPDGACKLAKAQAPLVEADDHFGDPVASSVRYESDLALFKPATDVILIGSAVAPKGEAARQLDVRISVGPVDRTIRVFGSRHWRVALLGAAASTPEEFTKIPLTFENAFGGKDPKDDSHPAWEPRNPVGKGFRVSPHDPLKGKPLDGWPLPHLENPAEPIREWKDRPAPTAPGFVCRSWGDRVRYAGTYDEAWAKQRCPILPTDFDYRYFNAAPPGQVCKGYLQGGEAVRLVHVTPQRELAFSLPRTRIQLEAICAKRLVRQDCVLDTVVLCTDRWQCLLVWRSSLRYRHSLDEFGAAAVLEAKG